MYFHCLDRFALVRLEPLSHLPPPQKLFVDAIEMLPIDVVTKPGFEVVFIGGNAEVKEEGKERRKERKKLPEDRFTVYAMQVDGMSSVAWLERRTANLGIPYRTMINLPRDEAIEVIKGEGHLLVLCTQVEVGCF